LHNEILHFLSRFSVKSKVAFIILFLITGLVFWNLSYIATNYERYEERVSITNDLEKAHAIESLVAVFESERRSALDLLYLSHDQEAFQKSIDTTQQRLHKLQSFMLQCNYDKKRSIVLKSLKKLEQIRSDVKAQKINGTEVVRFYTDSLIKHLVDIIGLMTQKHGTHGFVAYFNILNAIEYSALESDLTLAVMGEKSLNQQLYEVILLQSGKAQSAFDDFKRVAKSNQIQALYNSYKNRDFVTLNIEKENFRDALFVQGEAEFSLKNFNHASLVFIQNLHLVIQDVYQTLSQQIDKDRLHYLNQVYKDLAMLFIPLFVTAFISFFIFADINLSLRTLLEFLSETNQNHNREERMILLKSPSELGQVYRKLFTFNNKINEQIEIIRESYETDALTNLPNRVKLFSVLQEALDNKMRFTLLYIDIQNFSMINDSFGQRVGDLYLQKSAETLKMMVENSIAPSDHAVKVYRVGGDEFVIVCADKVRILEVITKLTDTHLVEHHDVEMPLNFTFGIAYSDEHSTPSSLITHAELALKDAQNYQKHYQIFEGDNSYKEHYRRNFEWVKRIKEAFNNKLFEAYFQPIVSVDDPSFKKYEVLIRLLNDDKSSVAAPIEFLSILQKMGLEKKLTKLIIDQSFTALQHCQSELSINMTREDLDDDMLHYFKDALKRYDVSSSLITIELIETEELMHDQYIRIIKAFKEMGCQIAIDDFGTGYSNFSYLSQIEPDFIKIDGSLIKDIDTNTQNRNIVKGIIDLAHSLEIKLIAEYVSSEEIYVIIQELGIEYAQGYYIGKAQSCEMILAKQS